MNCKNTDIFSPIRNCDEEKINRHSDGFSEFLKGPDSFKKKSVNSQTLENVNENTPVKNISNIKSSKIYQRKTAKYDVFSPVRNCDEEKINRHSDGFSEFLKGPGSFKKKSVNSEILENVDENTPVNNISNIKSSKIKQKKTGKYETGKNEKALASDCAFTTSPEKSSSLKKDRSKNLSLASKGNDKLRTNQQKGNDKLRTNQQKGNDKLRTNQQSGAECKNKKIYDSHSAKKTSVNLVKSSLQSGAAAVPIASRSKEIKKADEPSSVSQHNPLSQIKSGVLEKIINDAVEYQVDGIRQLLWSHHLNLLKATNNIRDEMEERRTENTNMLKIVEQLLEENRLLRTALLARQ